MTHSHYIILAFAVTALGMIGLVISSYSAMRRSEALADDLRNKD
jgi:heme exporter protein D